MKSFAKPKFGKQVLIFLVSFFVIVAVYLVVTRLQDNAEQERSPGSALTVAALASADVTSLSWASGSEGVALIRNGDQWQMAEDENFPLDQNKVVPMLAALSGVQAEQAINDVDVLSEYGLDHPELIISVKLAGGGEESFALSPAEEEGKYYLRYNEGSVVYVMGDRLRNAFNYEKYDMVMADQAPEYTQLKSMRITGDELLFNVVYSNSGASRAYSSKFHWFIQNDNGTFSAVDNELTEGLIVSVLDRAFEHCVDNYADVDELAGYGLAEPRYSVVISYDHQVEAADSGEAQDNAQFVLYIGADAGDDDYARLDGSNMVYLIPNELTESLINANAQSLRPDDVLLMDWETVESMDIAMSGASHVLEIARGDNIVYTLDGLAVEAELVEAFFTALDELESVGRADRNTDHGAELGIIFHRDHEDYPLMTFTLRPYDDNSDILSFNGQEDLLVAKEGILKAKDAFAALLAK